MAVAILPVSTSLCTQKLFQIFRSLAVRLFKCSQRECRRRYSACYRPGGVALSPVPTVVCILLVRTRNLFVHISSVDVILRAVNKDNLLGPSVECLLVLYKHDVRTGPAECSTVALETRCL